MRVGRIVEDGYTKAVEYDGKLVHLLVADIFEGVRTGDTRDAAAVQLASPCQPRKLFVIARGWKPVDGSEAPPGPPMVIAKVTSNVTGDGAAVRYPRFLKEKIWVEPELGVVIGKEIFRATQDEARRAIFGFTIFNDVTAFEFLQDTKDYFRAKSNDSFASMGPWINTGLSEADVLDGLHVECRVNGELQLEANTRTLRYAPSEVVSAVSMHTVLSMGDVISLGCPPPMPPEAGPGDYVELEIERIGTLHNTVAY